MSEPPAAFAPPVAHTIEWLQHEFGRYYALNPPPMPDRYTRREFGYILWPDRPGPPPFVRHRAYSDAEKFRWFLGKRGPHSVYYSTAYYRRPGAMKMLEKEWLGAELIFDLDADHLAEAETAKARGEEMPLADQLRIVKEQFKRLLDEFLFDDLGIAEKDVFITFSGGRGYHAHVMDPGLLGLDAKARREIVDYVTGKLPAEKGKETPDLTGFVWKEAVDTTGYGKFTKAVTRERIHPVTAPGWQGRMTRSLVAALQDRVLDAEREDAIAWLTNMDGLGAKSAQAFLDEFDQERLDRIAGGVLEQGPMVKRICHHVLKQQAIPLAKGETDEPVTADIKRLIRLPGSLHGKTGLKVVTLTRDSLNHFDPFTDAVALDMESVRFVPRFDNELDLGGERVRVEAGIEIDVPKSHAVFWAARQQGTVAMG